MIEIFLKRVDVPPAEQSKAVWTLLTDALSARGMGNLPEIVRNVYGKPYFKGNPIYFNLSHTKGAVAAAISDREIGLDIQAVRPIHPKTASRFLSTDSTDPRELTQKWAEFESYGKFLGCGIPILLPERPHMITSRDLGEWMLAVCGEWESAPDPIWVE